ncbi:MAG: PilZ domain-containing protein [candidate division Zixibacteria bacterium]|nr:PilZ domain-containing protein [candidate division Zixibacteria bacterium]
MAPSTPGSEREYQEFDTSSLEISLMVGRRVVLLCDQMPGKPLQAKVIQADQMSMSIDRGGEEGLIDSLVSDQDVTVRFNYKGQQISVPAVFKKSAVGKSSLILGPRAMALTRRRFTRLNLVQPVKLAMLPSPPPPSNRISRLRWLETDTINCSGGGMLIDLSSVLDKLSYLIMNIQLDRSLMPPLLLGQVRHCQQSGIGHFHIGVEFIVDNLKTEHFSPSALKRLPPALFEYTAAIRDELNRQLTVQVQNSNRMLPS